MKKYRFLFCAVLFSLVSGFVFSQNEGSALENAVTGSSGNGETSASLENTESSSGLSSNYSNYYSRIYDFANLLSPDEKSELEEMGFVLERKYNFPVYVLTVSDMAEYGYSFIERFAEDYFNQNNLGSGDEKNAIVLTLSIKDRDYDVMAHGEWGHYAFTDFGKEVLVKQFKPYLRDDDWYGAFYEYYYFLDYMLDEAKCGDPIDVGNYKEPRSMKDWAIAEGVIFAIALIIGLIAAAVETMKLDNVDLATDAENYIRPEDVRIMSRDSKFLRETKSVTHIEKSSSGGGTSVNSGGFSHSSGKF